VEDRERIREISGKIRSVIEGTAIAKDIDEAVTSHLTKLGDKNAYAARSSATAEDLLTASFAGQQDTYLNIIRKGSHTETHQQVLGVTLYGPGSDLPNAERFRPQQGPSVCSHPENGFPRGSRDYVYS
jgi:Pyruvate phosphate dikinase, AMP/ATP-binding domain